MKVEKSLSVKGEQSVVLVDHNYRIVEEVSQFLRYLEQNDCSSSTVESYCRDLKEFFRWLAKEGLKFYEVEPRMMFSFIEFLDTEVGRGNRKGPSTLNRYLASIASFYRFYESMHGYLERLNDTEGYYPVKRNRYKKTIYTQKVSPKQVNPSFFKRKKKKKGNTKRLFYNQIEVLYEAIDTNDKLGIGIRDRLMFRLLYETGFRIGECLGLRLSDFTPPDPTEEFGSIYIVKRVGKEMYHPDHAAKTVGREVPVSMDLIFAIDDYICNYRPQNEDIDSLIVNHRGPSAGSFMTRRPVEAFYRNLSQNTGIKCTPHTLRHTHGTELTEAGYNNLYVQHRLGHNSVETTAKYTHLSIESQTAAYGRFLKRRGGAMLS